MIQEIYIIDDDESCIPVFEQLFCHDKEYEFKCVKTQEIDTVLKNIPSLIIINEDSINRDAVEICKMIRQDEDNSITPIIVASSNPDKKHRIDIISKSVEYYIKKPVDEQYLYYTIKNLMRLMYMNRRVSPLTGLPGNVQIHAEMKKRMLNHEEFAVLYLDLDNFKAYNDVYGFIKGDEIIKYTARVIVRNVHNIEDNNCFVGHIGGDDFVAIVEKTDYDVLCQNILADFEQNINQFFNIQDRERGYLEVANRRGIIEQFPLTSLSIGVVEVDPGRFKNILEIGEIGAQVKHNAKTVLGSSYAINRRKK